MRIISGGSEPCHIGGSLARIPDEHDQSRIAAALAKQFDVTYQDGAALSGPMRLVLYSNDVIVLHVVYRIEPAGYSAYATAAKGKQKLAQAILAFLDEELHNLPS